MPNLSFEDALRPTTLDAFLDRHRDQAPLHVARASPGYFRSLVSLAEIDEFLDRARPPFTKAFAIDNARKIEIGEYSDPDGVVDPGRLYQLFERGCTIVLREVDANFPALGALCRSAERRLGSPFFANVYYAPPGGQSFPIHYDAPDVFALQVEGRKIWRLYKPRYEKPLADQHCYGDLPEEGFLREVALEAGDLLYIPRGFPHLVRAGERPSLHVSLSSFPSTRADALGLAVSELARRDPAFRAALPPEREPDAGMQATFAALLARFAEGAALGPALADIARRLAASRPARPSEPRARPRQAAKLTLESWLARNDAAPVYFERVGDTLRLTGYCKELVFAGEAYDDLAFALATPRFQIKATPGALEAEGKLDLFQTLLLSGFVCAV